MGKIRNMGDLVDDLTALYSQLRAGEVSPKDAKEINNTAGKIINATKVQVEYLSIRDSLPEKIAFMERHKSDE